MYVKKGFKDQKKAEAQNFESMSATKFAQIDSIVMSIKNMNDAITTSRNEIAAEQAALNDISNQMNRTQETNTKWIEKFEQILSDK